MPKPGEKIVAERPDAPINANDRENVPPQDVLTKEDPTTGEKKSESKSEEGDGEAAPKMLEPVVEDDLRFALDKLKLRRDVTERLYSQLQARKITTYAEARGRIGEVASALQAAYGAEAMRVLDVLREVESGSA